MNYLLILKTEAGIALIAAIFLIVVFGFLSVAVVSLVSTQGFSAMNELKSDQALFIAEGGMERALYLFQNGTACAALTNAVPTSLGVGSFTTVGTLYRPASTLINQAGGINNAVTTITVDSTAGYAPYGRIRIDSELIDYTGMTATSFTGARRGIGGTTAAAHADNTPVAQNQCRVRSIGTVAGPVGNSQRIVESNVVNSPTVQTGTVTIAGNPSPTLNVALATAVDPVRAFLIFNTRHNSNRPVGSMVRGQILNANTIQFQQATNANLPIDIRWYVVEYFSGVTVQRGSVNQVDSIIATSPLTETNVALPTAVSALNRAFVTWSKTPDPVNSSWSDDDPILGELINTTTLQFRSSQANGAPNHTIWWQVIDFPNPAELDVNVQKGTIPATAMPAGGITNLTRPLAAVNVNKTFVLVGYRASGGSDADVGSRMLRAQLTNATTITIDRGTAVGGTIDEITWQAIEFRDNTLVQGGSRNFPNGNNQQLVNLGTPVDVTRSIAFASVQAVAGQSMGRTPYAPGGGNDADFTGVGSVTMGLIPAAGPATQIQMDRNSTVSSSDIGWFVAQFDRKPRFEWTEVFQ